MRLSPEHEAEARENYRNGTASPSEAYALGLHDAILEGAAKADAKALMAALKEGEIVAQARATREGFTIRFVDKGETEEVVVHPKIQSAANGAMKVTPEIAAAMREANGNPQKAEDSLQQRLTKILVEECASDSEFPLRSRLEGRIFEVVAPVSETKLVARQKADWFTGRVMGVLERREPKKMSADDLAALVADIASIGKRGKV